MDTYYREILNLYPLILVALQNCKTLNFALENQFSHIAPPTLLISSAAGLSTIQLSMSSLDSPVYSLCRVMTCQSATSLD